MIAMIVRVALHSSPTQILGMLKTRSAIIMAPTHTVNRSALSHSPQVLREMVRLELQQLVWARAAAFSIALIMVAMQVVAALPAARARLPEAGIVASESVVLTALRTTSIGTCRADQGVLARALLQYVASPDVDLAFDAKTAIGNAEGVEDEVAVEVDEMVKEGRWCRDDLERLQRNLMRK